MKKKHEKVKLELIEDLKDTKRLEKIFCCFQYYDKKKKEHTTHSVIIGDIYSDMLGWMRDTVASELNNDNKRSEAMDFASKADYYSDMIIAKLKNTGAIK